MDTPKKLADLIGLHLIEGAHEAWAYTPSSSTSPRSTEHEYDDILDLDEDDNLDDEEHEYDDILDLDEDNDLDDDDSADPDLVFFVKIDGEEYALFNSGSALKPEMGMSCQGSSSWPASSDLAVLPSVETPPLTCNLFWRPVTDLPLDPTDLPRPLDLPLASEPDRVLVAVDEARNLIVLEVGIESYAYQVPGLVHRTTLPIGRTPSVLRGDTIRVSSMPQQSAFRPSRLIIGGRPGLWIVQDIQLAGQHLITGDIPGDVFAATYPNNLFFPVAQPGQVFNIAVRYMGDSPSGEPFIAAMFGESQPQPQPLTRIGRRFVMRWTPEGRFEPWMAAHPSGEEDLPLPPPV